MSPAARAVRAIDFDDCGYGPYVRPLAAEHERLIDVFIALRARSTDDLDRGD
ncbi:hypothetical protein Psi02_15980 [Planotetraspora silvatica]|uniref:Uncharacterized protein n=1 Tax=Planotetraspora silvatica TaxID=234614 RepID=A0A8J3UGI0_9ACTN|nr:hypothetical protein [Planotetraspora silvatica]GII45174.1 hypothetical protein Psi02_15980 [Planotetraspora silvatica]